MEPYSDSLFALPPLSPTAKKAGRKKGKGSLILPHSYVIIDIETTGLYPARDAIIEIGAILVQGSSAVREFQTFLQPEPYRRLTPFITNLTGIRNEDLAQAPRFADILPEFRSFIGGYTLAGHNLNFDIDFLYDRIYQITGEHLDNPWLDTRRLAKTVLPGLPHYSLEFLCQYFGIEGNHHRAVDDCRLTKEVLEKLYAISSRS